MFIFAFIYLMCTYKQLTIPTVICVYTLRSVQPVFPCSLPLSPPPSIELLSLRLTTGSWAQQWEISVCLRDRGCIVPVRPSNTHTDEHKHLNHTGHVTRGSHSLSSKHLDLKLLVFKMFVIVDKPARLERPHLSLHCPAFVHLSNSAKMTRTFMQISQKQFLRCLLPPPL